jgi:hypothetical protein
MCFGCASIHEQKRIVVGAVGSIGCDDSGGVYSRTTFDSRENSDNGFDDLALLAKSGSNSMMKESVPMVWWVQICMNKEMEVRDEVG